MLRWALFVPLLSACALAPKRPMPSSVDIVFKGRPGTSVETLYHSTSQTKVYSDQQLTNDRQEIIDFTIASRVTAVDAKTGAVTTLAKTTRKDGTSDLHDLAFPEFGEEIEFIISPKGDVLKAGKYSPQGIFYVPSLPVPKGPVSVGDTWELEHAWMSKEGLPLKIAVIGILKRIVECDQGVCADFEISGGVQLGIPPTATGAKFESRIWGRVLFSLDRGDVIWSEVRSREDMGAGNGRTVVQSCMVSRTILRGGTKAPTCAPSDQPVEPPANL